MLAYFVKIITATALVLYLTKSCCFGKLKVSSEEFPGINYCDGKKLNMLDSDNSAPHSYYGRKPYSSTDLKSSPDDSKDYDAIAKQACERYGSIIHASYVGFCEYMDVKFSDMDKKTPVWIVLCYDTDENITKPYNCLTMKLGEPEKMMVWEIKKTHECVPKKTI